MRKTTTNRRFGSRRERGQALVLMSLMGLFLALMVLMSIGITNRIKEKMEVQQVADASAYSTAVVTSRTINTVAVLNRVHIATMAALAANQSIISWVGLYRGALNRAEFLLTPLAIANCIPGTNPCLPGCTATQNALQAVKDAQEDVKGDWDDLDKAAGEQSREFQKSVVGYQAVTMQKLRDRFIDQQALAREIITYASQGDPHTEWSVAVQGDTVTGDEQSWFKDNGEQDKEQDEEAYFLVPRRETRELTVEAAHGTRGREWVTKRTALGNQIIAMKLMDVLSTAVAGASARGEGWFDNEALPGDAGEYGTSPRGAVGSDRATFIAAVTFCPYVLPMPATASVFSDDRDQSTEDEHVWNGKNDKEEDEQERHTMGGCTACPGIWTHFVDLNPKQVDREARWKRLYGQPKVMTAIERDYSKRDPPDPWMLDFEIDFAGNDGSFDNRGVRTTGSGGTDINVQFAISTALSYYHRPDNHWAEPPNFFNPFWRATLVSTGVDNGGHPNPQGDRAAAGGAGEQLKRLLDALPHGDAGKNVVEKLADANFQGWQ